MASNFDDDQDWMEDFHSQVQEEEIERLRERDEQLELEAKEAAKRSLDLQEEINLLRVNGEDERQIFIDEIKRLRTKLTETQKSSDLIQPRIEPPPEICSETVSSAERNPQQQYRAINVSGRERGRQVAARGSDEADHVEYPRASTSGEEQEQSQFQEMQTILLNNMPDKRTQGQLNKSRHKTTQKDASCSPMEDVSVMMESRILHEFETPLGYERATASDPDVFIREPIQISKSIKEEQPTRSYETPAFPHASANINYGQRFQVRDHHDAVVEQMKLELQHLKQEGSELRQMFTGQVPSGIHKKKKKRTPTSHEVVSSEVRRKDGGDMTPGNVSIERQKGSIRRVKEEMSDTESVDSEEEEPHHNTGPWRLRREDCIKGIDKFRSRMERPKQKQITPEPFKGDVPLQEYLSQFESVATWNGWTDSQKAQQLFMSLRDRARGVIRQQDEWRTITYQELVKRLETTFSGQAELYLAQLRGRQQQQQESLQDFAQAVRKLTDNAYVGMAEEARNRIARDHFMGNMRDREIRSAVHLSRPTSIEAALQTALETEAFLTTEKQKQPTKFVKSVEQSDRVLEDQLREVIGLLKTVAEKASKAESSKQSESTVKGQAAEAPQAPNYGRGRGRRRGSGRQDPGRERACYRCGAFDHYIASCPQAQRSSRGGWNHPGNDFRPNLGAPEGSKSEAWAPENQQ